MPFPQMGNNPKEKACILIGHAPLSSASMGKMFTTRALLQIHITGAAGAVLLPSKNFQLQRREMCRRLHFWHHL